MYGYIFETTNIKTGEKFIGKRYAVSFDKHFFGEDADIEKYGKDGFTVKMIVPPFDNQQALDAKYEEMLKSYKKVKAPKVEEPVEEEVPVKKTTRKKKSEEV